MADSFAVGARVTAGPLTGTVVDPKGVVLIGADLRLVKFDAPSNVTGIFPVSMLKMAA